MWVVEVRFFQPGRRPVISPLLCLNWPDHATATRLRVSRLVVDDNWLAIVLLWISWSPQQQAVRVTGQPGNTSLGVHGHADT